MLERARPKGQRMAGEFGNFMAGSSGRSGRQARDHQRKVSARSARQARQPPRRRPCGTARSAEHDVHRGAALAEPNRSRSARCRIGSYRAITVRTAALPETSTATAWNSWSARARHPHHRDRWAASKRSLASRMRSRSPVVSRGTALSTARRCMAATTVWASRTLVLVERGDDRRAAGKRADEPGPPQFEERLADRRSTHAEPRGEFGVAQLLVRGRGCRRRSRRGVARTLRPAAGGVEASEVRGAGMQYIAFQGRALST